MCVSKWSYPQRTKALNFLELGLIALWVTNVGSGNQTGSSERSVSTMYQVSTQKADPSLCEDHEFWWLKLKK